MVEAEHPVVGPPRPLRIDQLAAAQRVEMHFEIGTDLGRHELEQRAPGEVSTDDRRCFRARSAPRGPQLLDAGRECRVDRRWQLDSAGVDPALPQLVVDAPQHAVVDEQAQQLAKEQRISFAGVDGPRETPGGIASVGSKSSAMRSRRPRRAGRGGRRDRMGPRPRQAKGVAHEARAAPKRG